MPSDVRSWPRISDLVSGSDLGYNGIMSDNIDQKEWPNTVRNRAELDAALEAGLEGGVSDLSMDDLIERAKKRHGIT